MYTRLLQGYDSMDSGQQSASSYAAKHLRLMVSSHLHWKQCLSLSLSLSVPEILKTTCYAQNCLKVCKCMIYGLNLPVGLDSTLNLQGPTCIVAMLIQSTAELPWDICYTVYIQ